MVVVRAYRVVGLSKLAFLELPALGDQILGYFFTIGSEPMQTIPVETSISIQV